MLNGVNSDQLLFCAEECERQKVGPRMVYHMGKAMALAETQGTVTVQFVKDLGLFVDPKQNEFGYRRVQVFFANTLHFTMGEAAKPEHIEEQVETLVGAWLDERVTPEEFYHHFQMIHPFLDGNGRVGAILFNHMKGTLDAPKSAPDFFSGEIKGTLPASRV